ncbi:methyltransferase domain-containing protein [Denitratisoma sp. agr-D3]
MSTAAQAAFAGAAETYDAAAVLAQEVGRRMAERLAYVRLEPQRLMDVGCATGDGIRDLMVRYPKALPIAADYAKPMLDAVASRHGWLDRLRGKTPRLLGADVRQLPLAANSLDLIWSNLMLHWLEDPLPAFKELHRVMTVGGLLTFSMLGPDTLKEIRRAFAACGVTPSLRPFLDMHDVGDMLVAAGFADPVMDMEHVVLTYRSPRGLLRDQRHLGVRDALLGHLPWRQWRQVLAAWTRVEGLLPASFEIVYGHAWKPAAKVVDDGRAIIQFHKTRPAS